LPAPGRFSTITGTLHFAFSRLASTRATASTVPPASNGTTILTVRSGKSACAGAGTRMATARIAGSRDGGLFTFAFRVRSRSFSNFCGGTYHSGTKSASGEGPGREGAWPERFAWR